MTKVFTVTTRGLEAVSAAELAAVSGVTIEQVAYRRVLATCRGSLAPLLKLRTVDDVFLYVTTWDGIGRPRSTLDTLKAASARLRLARFAGLCAQVRALPDPPIFSVSANFVGRRNYSTPEIKEACAGGIMAGQGWIYSENDEAAGLNVRLFIDGDTALVGVRLGEHPLSKRPYKQHNVPGSLKPPVAAALAALVDVGPGMRVLDPCCGAGTILIEARAYRAEAWGGDVDLGAVMAARDNAAAAGEDVSLQCWDGGALPLADQSVDRVICNVPWGRAVSTPDSLHALYDGLGAEIKRVLAPGGQAALLTNRPDLVQIKGLKCVSRTEISLFGQTPTIMVWVDRANKNIG